MARRRIDDRDVGSQLCSGVGGREPPRRLRSRAPSSQPDARVGRRLQYVDDGVDDDVGDSDHERDPRDGRKVADRDRLGRNQSDSGPREHGFDYHNSGEHESRLEAEHRECRAGGVSQRVAVEDRSFSQAL